MNKDIVFAIRDRFHHWINGETMPEVRSDNPCFEGKLEEFFIWCSQHGGQDEIYCIGGDTPENLEFLGQMKRKYLWFHYR